MMQKAMRMAGKMRRWLGFRSCRLLSFIALGGFEWSAALVSCEWSNILLETRENFKNLRLQTLELEVHFFQVFCQRLLLEGLIRHIFILLNLPSFPLFPWGRDSDQDNYEQVEGKVIKPPVVVYSSQPGWFDMRWTSWITKKHCYKCPSYVEDTKASSKHDYSLPLSKKCGFSPNSVCIGYDEGINMKLMSFVENCSVW